MNKFSKFLNETLTSYYKKRMDDCLETSMDAEREGHPAMSFTAYNYYLKYKKKWEKCCERK